MTATDDLFNMPSPTQKEGSYTANTTLNRNRPYFGIDPNSLHPGAPANNGLQYTHNGSQWTSATTEIVPSNEAFIQGLEGQIKALTMIVSANNDYLLNQIEIEVGHTDTFIKIPIFAVHKRQTFVIPKGEMTHSLAKKYLDWLAMVQLILQDA